MVRVCKISKCKVGTRPEHTRNLNGDIFTVKSIKSSGIDAISGATLHGVTSALEERRYSAEGDKAVVLSLSVVAI